MTDKSLPPTILIIFGVSGDLSSRYLLPALNTTFESGHMPEKFKVIGVSRRDINPNELLGKNGEALAGSFEIYKMDMSSLADYKNLKSKLDDIAGEFGSKTQIIFYFAVPPATVLPIIRSLGSAKLNGENVKLMLEKPFGTDLESAQELIEQTNKYFKEEQIYRIDHYLAKEMAQNIVVFLGGNALFRDVWNRDFIERIEILVCESIGIEGRAGFYEQTGALRDIVQSHLLQLAALTLMEPCSDLFEFSEMPARRLAALESLQTVPPDKFSQCVIRAQYDNYRKEVNDLKTTTETFVALTLNSSNPRWQDVPIKLITGKNLDQRLTEIRVYFKKNSASEANVLSLRIQPKEGIELDLWVKEPGYERKLRKLSLSFAYERHFERLPEAYEQVLVDAVRGSQSLFASSEEVLATWSILQPIQHYWGMQNKDLKFYKAGSTPDEVTKQLA